MEPATSSDRRPRRPIWLTSLIAAIVLALGIGGLWVLNDCRGVPYESEQCLWSRSLYLLQAGVLFLPLWPACFIAGHALAALRRRRS